MAYAYFKRDPDTGKWKRLSALWTDTKVQSTGQTDFTVTGLASGSVLDVYVNGVLIDEADATEGFVRNVGQAKITFNTSVPVNAKVRIRLWS